MKPKHAEVVSASEIASWEWCPESWRLGAIGREPENRAELARGEAFHDRTSAAEVWTRRALALGAVLLVLGLVAAACFAIISAVGP